LAISFKYSDAPPRPDFQGASCRLAFPDAGEMAGKHAGFGFCSSPVPGSAAFRRATDTRVLPTLLPRPNSVCTDVKPGAHCLPQPCVQHKAAWQRQRQSRGGLSARPVLSILKGESHRASRNAAGRRAMPHVGWTPRACSAKVGSVRFSRSSFPSTNTISASLRFRWHERPPDEHIGWRAPRGTRPAACSSAQVASAALRGRGFLATFRTQFSTKFPGTSRPGRSRR